MQINQTSNTTNTSSTTLKQDLPQDTNPSFWSNEQRYLLYMYISYSYKNSHYWLCSALWLAIHHIFFLSTLSLSYQPFNFMLPYFVSIINACLEIYNIIVYFILDFNPKHLQENHLVSLLVFPKLVLKD